MKRCALNTAVFMLFSIFTDHRTRSNVSPSVNWEPSKLVPSGSRATFSRTVFLQTFRRPIPLLTSYNSGLIC